AHRQWLQEKLTYSNEASLRHRLRELLGEAETIMSPIFPDNRKRRTFIQKVVSIRNDLTHRLKTAAARPEDLFCLSEILFFLVSACLLIRAGLPKARLVKFFRNNYRYARCADYSIG
ncbi:MAG: HEPN domain-containing protein, partial [Candidatus Binatia bacterium]